MRFGGVGVVGIVFWRGQEGRRRVREGRRREDAVVKYIYDGSLLYTLPLSTPWLMLAFFP